MSDVQPTPQVVKVITTDDLFNEVTGLRRDVQEFLEKHGHIPEQVKELRADVDALLRFRWVLTGMMLASGGVGAVVAKSIGG